MSTGILPQLQDVGMETEDWVKLENAVATVWQEGSQPDRDSPAATECGC